MLIQIRKLYRLIFPNYLDELKRELSGCGEVLDLGCGYNSPLQYVEVSHSLGVDLFQPNIEESKKKGHPL